ncbi:winged helix-turn-helix transcriptional regulator [Cellulomonas sp. zg-ZUI199]|uniref:Winged helix-turn-helix transcriptional regulator n=1 Tax=Cellulomonas wangleii TaxID=2816956 RepID=A0ABX8D718_9CELL|nr:MarR family winged helix-turn-helix transcriptional regulator [Cellulomonas wangleii]MBO0926116.1 winged helix-turn-helix transcriptional regulator [Cellulomonas wangleii]QVI62635.1 winged helix-turn-helix transcriptional regulator [Cellulomonas wangleii]
MPRTGADLALLLLGGYRALVDAATAGLAVGGHGDFRPVHEFAMRAIAAGADGATELGRRTGVSKQAAAKTIAVLVERGYVATAPDPADGRRTRLEVTPLGREVLRRGEDALDGLRAQWAQRLGPDRLAALEADLATLVGDRAVDPSAPGRTTEDAARA